MCKFCYHPVLNFLFYGLLLLGLSGRVLFFGFAPLVVVCCSRQPLWLWTLLTCEHLAFWLLWIKFEVTWCLHLGPKQFKRALFCNSWERVDGEQPSGLVQRKFVDKKIKIMSKWIQQIHFSWRWGKLQRQALTITSNTFHLVARHLINY